jgi:hypothetical protein
MSVSQKCQQSSQIPQLANLHESLITSPFATKSLNGNGGPNQRKAMADFD